MATLTFRLTIVPTRVSNGRSGGGGARTSCFCGATIAAATTGGRREAEKSGRSRVAVRALSGIAHSGLPARDLPPGSRTRSAPESPAGSAAPFPSAADADVRSTSGAGGGNPSIGPAAAVAARAQKAAASIPKSRITAMTAIAPRPRSSFACARSPAPRKPQATGSKACLRTGMASLPRCRKGSSARLADRSPRWPSD
jgi:hypothetical protein